MPRQRQRCITDWARSPGSTCRPCLHLPLDSLVEVLRYAGGLREIVVFTFLLSRGLCEQLCNSSGLWRSFDLPVAKFSTARSIVRYMCASVGTIRSLTFTLEDCEIIEKEDQDSIVSLLNHAPKLEDLTLGQTCVVKALRHIHSAKGVKAPFVRRLANTRGWQSMGSLVVGRNFRQETWGTTSLSKYLAKAGNLFSI